MIRAANAMRILVVDDLQDNQVFICRAISTMGHQPILATSGEEAIEKFLADQPDMILMDVMMPGIGGLEATRRIRAAAGDRWLPILMVTALGHEEAIVEGLNAGADDYLLKPLSLKILMAKIRTFQHIARLQNELASRTRELDAYYRQAEEERRVGSRLMEYMIARPGLNDPAVRFRTVPAWHFSGDILAAAETPGGARHAMLSDGMGHGLPAAITSLPLFDTFYSMTELGYGIGRIVEEMNRRLHAMSPPGHFVAATLVSIHPLAGVIEVWNGGNPHPCLVGPDGQIVKRWRSSHLPLGILNPDKFSADLEAYPFDASAQFYMWSDGLNDLESPDGDLYGPERAYEVLEANDATDRFDNLVGEIDSHRAGAELKDDISLMMIAVPEPGGVESPGARISEHERWPKQIHLAFHFDAREMKYLDIVPMLTGLVENIVGMRARVGQIYLILAELVNNALDHGLLKLDSSLKSSHDGFDLYLRTRRQRLKQLQEGSVSIKLDGVQIDGKDFLKITVRDSGDGFDVAGALHRIAGSKLPHGRGIGLVRQLCSDLRYSASGNEVVAYHAIGIQEPERVVA